MYRSVVIGGPRASSICYRVVSMVALVWAVWLCQPSLASRVGSVEGFYRGKTLTIIVGASSGGSYDLYARVLARHIGRYIPGHPTVIVQNMPAAGGLVAANYLYKVAPRDGTVMEIWRNALIQQQLIGAPGVEFDAGRLNWVGNMNEEGYFCGIRRDAPAKSFEELRTTPVKIGVTGPGAASYTHVLFLNEVYGTKLQPIAGYPGGTEIVLAIERGAVHGRCGWPVSDAFATRRDLLQGPEPLVHVVVQMGAGKHPGLPNVPLLVEYANNEWARALTETFFLPLRLGRAFALPPGVPEERIRALRQAFDATLRDPQFRADAERASLELNGVLTGKEVESLVRRLLDAPREQIAAIAQYLK